MSVGQSLLKVISALTVDDVKQMVDMGLGDDAKEFLFAFDKLVVAWLGSSSWEARNWKLWHRICVKLGERYGALHEARHQAGKVMKDNEETEASRFINRRWPAIWNLNKGVK